MVAEELLQFLKERQQLNDNGMTSHRRNEFEKLHYYYFKKYALYHILEECFENMFFKQNDILSHTLKIFTEEKEELKEKKWEKHFSQKQKELKKLEQNLCFCESGSKRNKTIKNIEKVKEEIHIQNQELCDYIDVLHQYHEILLRLSKESNMIIQKGLTHQYLKEIKKIYGASNKVMIDYVNLRREEENCKVALQACEQKIQKLEKKEHDHVLKAIGVKDNSYILKCFICNKYILLPKNHSKASYFLTATGGVYKERKDRIPILEDYTQKVMKKQMKK